MKSKMRKQFSFVKLATFLQKPVFLAFVYFVIMTILMTYPLILKMGTSAIGGGGGDGTYFIWLVRWYQKALFELKISPFFNPFLNYPQGWNLATTDITPAMVAFALPGSLFFGPTWGYNFAMLVSFILSGWGMYLWVKHLTKSDLAGLIAGTIFAFIPFKMAHYITGHLSLAGTQWFPFYFWGLFDLLKQVKFSWKPVLLASLAAGLIGLTSPYYVYMTIIISAVFLVGFLIFKGFKRLKDKEFWKSVTAFGLLAVLLVGVSMLPYLNLNAQSGLADRSVDYLNRYSASISDFFMPSVKQFLWGQWIDNHFSPEFYNEATLYIGAVSFVLAMLAWWKWRKADFPDLLGISLVVTIASIILALGIQLHWLGEQVTFLPRILQPIFHRTAMPQIFLPAYYLYKFLPFFSKMRVMMRFGLFALIFFSMTAGLGASILIKSAAPKIKAWVGIGLLILVFIDFYPGPLTGFVPTTARPVDGWLAEQPAIGALAQFPFSQESEQSQVYNTIVNQKPFLGGYFNANQPEQYLRIMPVMEGFPSNESVAMLKTLGVAYVVVDSSQYTNYPDVDQSIRALGLPLLHISEMEYVYGLP
jgi:hypothetical protein